MKVLKLLPPPTHSAQPAAHSSALPPTAAAARCRPPRGAAPRGRPELRACCAARPRCARTRWTCRGRQPRPYAPRRRHRGARIKREGTPSSMCMGRAERAPFGKGVWAHGGVLSPEEIQARQGLLGVGLAGRPSTLALRDAPAGCPGEPASCACVSWHPQHVCGHLRLPADGACCSLLVLPGARVAARAGRAPRAWRARAQEPRAGAAIRLRPRGWGRRGGPPSRDAERLAR